MWRGNELPRRVAVWAPHALKAMDVESAAQGAFKRLRELQRVSLIPPEILRHGLVLMPAHGSSRYDEAGNATIKAGAIAFDGSGDSLRQGRDAIRAFVRNFVDIAS